MHLDRRPRSDRNRKAYAIDSYPGKALTTAMDKMCAISDMIMKHRKNAKLITNRLRQDPDDVVITLAIRSPMCKGHKGGFRETQLDALVYRMLRAVIERGGIDPALVEDICLGNVCDTAMFTPLRRRLREDRSAKAKQDGTAERQR